ncbi:hypothetical protein TRSC58_07219 [Trypanosoma rangeli SC58]|uniref:Uncharacterized protein n=1 Tax=Trypanosoma rangeli SC58 TaxID=429131 RepID=A0A061IT95_TRYRA|nr:hypothetical protein TRSC58_07219 [Trypanosoma rangeli SC58]
MLSSQLWLFLYFFCVYVRFGVLLLFVWRRGERSRDGEEMKKTMGGCPRVWGVWEWDLLRTLWCTFSLCFFF